MGDQHFITFNYSENMEGMDTHFMASGFVNQSPTPDVSSGYINNETNNYEITDVKSEPVEPEQQPPPEVDLKVVRPDKADVIDPSKNK